MYFGADPLNRRAVKSNERIYTNWRSQKEKTVKSFFGFLMILAAIFMGLYVGVWICIVGSIVDAINLIKGSDPATAGAVFWIFARWVLAGFAGWITFIVLLIPGIALLKE